ncbi:sensor histidine kinase [Alkaliphilus oremlandii]|uniref:histidine kinase n=1 Tax=Alkaliphilus oremlandii (strain OhILAs) TaxID=350688 RepID=A8MKI2_ALKOO|nr:ATP-binding protein [Alkaliphilus oremlandii]ABW20314.1 multi-sensor signal transduction histidine kinase [Alkaliphilus oremlandii OhILAs]
MFKSIRWKFITIYFLLVFMAMVIIGVFLMQQFEQYHLGVVSDNLSSLANTVITSLKTIDWQNNPMEVEENIRSYEQMGMGITIIKNDSNFSIIFSTNPLYTKNSADTNATQFLESELILKALSGGPAEKDHIDEGNKLNSSKHMVVPIHDENNRIAGVIYLKSNLEDIYKTLEESKTIIMKATFLALFITIFLGYFIAKSITGPINDVTVKAAQMAKGDFEQIVEVRSDDEIGQLANMFNYLTARLKGVLQEVSSEKQKLDTIITYMADGIIAATKEGEILHVNPKAMEMLNIEEGQLAPRNFNEIFKPYDEEFEMDYLLEMSENQTGQRMLYVEDGVILEASYAPFINENGALGGIILLLQDVTSAQKLENMRKEFVANVSHELKTPLTTIKSYTETLLDGVLENTELATSFLQVVDGEAERMARLVRDLLQLSNLDYKKSNWNKKEVNLNEIIENSILKIDVSAKNKAQEIITHLQDEPVHIYADKDRIEQVILNILSNSIKYTPEGGRIIVDLIVDEGVVTLKIRDTGIGIPKEDIARIFERFYRVDKARSREMGGTGLGLSIAKQIIEAHEGTIEIFSEEGHGTEVHTKLPVTEITLQKEYNV